MADSQVANGVREVLQEENPFLEFARRYRRDPVGFVRNVFEVEPDEWQAEVLEDVFVRDVRQISIRSCHGVGKSAVEAWIAVIACCVFPAAKVVMTAPSGPQLFDVLYAETCMWFRRLPDALGQLFDIQKERVEHIGARESIFVSPRTSRAEKPEAMQGVHAEEGIVILLVDEASGVPEPVFEAAVGSMSGENACTILASNPTRTSGTFFDSQTRLRGDWKCYKISHEDSNRVSRKFVEEVAKKYGEDSNQFRVRCLAEFPRADDDTFISLELAESARDREIVVEEPPAPSWGLDVSRFGDDKTVLLSRAGRETQWIRRWEKADTMQTVGRVVAAYREAEVKPAEICIDVIGIGAGVVDRLQELARTEPDLKGLNVVAVNVSESPSFEGERTYFNLRAELWGRAKEWLETLAVKLIPDEELIGELTVPRYKFTSNGKLQIESKEEMKKRGVASPNAADALCLTFAGAAARVGRASGHSDWSKPLRRRIKGVV